MDCTCGYSQKRGTLDLIEAEDIREIFDEIESSPVMETLWKTYQKIILMLLIFHGMQL